MRTRLLLVFFTVFSIVLNAQNGINYKALIKDDNGNAITNQAVTIQFQILADGTTNVYQETHNPTTDTNGIIIVNIGEGTVDSGNFVAIDWGANSHFLNVQVDTGNGLVDLGTTEFKSVPYAKVADMAIKSPVSDFALLKARGGIIGANDKVTFQFEEFDLTDNFTPNLGSTVPTDNRFIATEAGYYEIQMDAKTTINVSNSFDSVRLILLANGSLLKSNTFRSKTANLTVNDYNVRTIKSTTFLDIGGYIDVLVTNVGANTSVGEISLEIKRIR